MRLRRGKNTKCEYMIGQKQHEDVFDWYCSRYLYIGLVWPSYGKFMYISWYYIITAKGGKGGHVQNLGFHSWTSLHYRTYLLLLLAHTVQNRSLKPPSSCAC